VNDNFFIGYKKPKTNQEKKNIKGPVTGVLVVLYFSEKI